MESMQNVIEHHTFSELAGKPSMKAALVSSAAGWTIQARTGGHSKVLIAERSKAPRVFRRMETAAAYLRNLGIKKFIVEIEEPVRAQTPENRRRPDRSKAMQRTFASASEWKKWFVSEVNAAVREADSPTAEWQAHEDVKVQWATRREELLKSITQPLDV